MNELKQTAREWFSAHEGEMLEMLKDLVSIRSVSDASAGKPGAPFGEGCRRVLTRALELAAGMGFETRDCEGYCGTASLGDDEHALGIAAHLDVVPEGDKWIHAPYAPVREGDFLFGRGVGDNKSAAVMGLFLMKFFRENHPLRHGLRLIMGCSEETGMKDLSYYAEKYPCPDFTLVADSGFPVNYAQKGTLRGRFAAPAGSVLTGFSGGEVFNMVPPHAKARLTGYAGELPEAEDIRTEREGGDIWVFARGVAAHAAAPEGGRSAIHTLAGYLKGLSLDPDSVKLAEGIWEVSRDTTGENMGVFGEDPDTGKTTMVIGTARTENGMVELQVDARLSLACDPEACAANFAERAARLGFSMVHAETTKPVWLPKDDEKVQALQKVYSDFTGRDDPPYTSGGGTYSRVLPNVVTFGPGLRGEWPRPELPEGHGGAHAPDEYLTIPAWLEGCALYACALAELDRIV